MSKSSALMQTQLLFNAYWLSSNMVRSLYVCTFERALLSMVYAYTHTVLLAYILRFCNLQWEAIKMLQCPLQLRAVKEYEHAGCRSSVCLHYVYPSPPARDIAAHFHGMRIRGCSLAHEIRDSSANRVLGYTRFVVFTLFLRGEQYERTNIL